MDVKVEETQEMVKEMPRKLLFDLIQECPDKTMDKKFLFMEKKLIEMTKCPEDKLGSLRSSLTLFKSHFRQKWAAANFMKERFLRKNEQWLNNSIKLATWTVSKPGRPTKDFGESSDRSKRRKTKDMREHVPHDELTYAASMSQRAAGNTDASKIMKEITLTPTRATKYRKIITSKEKQPVKKHTPSEALSIFVEADLTRKQWEIIHAANKNIYPCYSIIKKAKKDCYPKEESIRVTETSAEIVLQDLLDHTSLRLCKYLEEVITSLTEEEKLNLELLSKWGCDGSQQSQFKQKFQNNTDSDANIFQSSFVPLRLICNIGDKKKTIWQNTVPSSTRFCRPIRIRFVHETNDITKEEIQYIENQVRNLKKTEISTINDGLLHIKHTLVPTMVDAKVCNAATSTSSTMKCYICGETSKNFNKLNNQKVEDPNVLRFGLSILHARIRFFESLLHMSYKIPLKKWQARTSKDKKVVAETKKRIQESFKEEMGLLVDIPKVGFGNTNDGNTSRRFFADPDIASRITGVDITLIKKFKVILETLSSGHKIDVQKFANYAQETAKLYIKLYGWHPMSPTIHKILIHGATVIQHAILPIGQLSEEAAEARNKHFRQYRQNFSRKFSREQCNRDVLNRLLLSSDPLLSSTRQRPHKKSKPFSTETLELLLPETPYVCSTQDNSDKENEDEEETDFEESE